MRFTAPAEEPLCKHCHSCQGLWDSYCGVGVVQSCQLLRLNYWKGMTCDFRKMGKRTLWLIITDWQYRGVSELWHGLCSSKYLFFCSHTVYDSWLNQTAAHSMWYSRLQDRIVLLNNMVIGNSCRLRCFPSITELHENTKKFRFFFWDKWYRGYILWLEQFEFK